MADHFKRRIAEEMENVALLPREIVVQADHVMALGQQPLAQVGSQKSGSPGHKNSRGIEKVRTHKNTPSLSSISRPAPVRHSAKAKFEARNSKFETNLKL
jgi:hypothetical protein